MYVFDATPLIYLAKAERLALVRELPADCTVPERVFEEVVTRGIEEGHADARRVHPASWRSGFAGGRRGVFKEPLGSAGGFRHGP